MITKIDRRFFPIDRVKKDSRVLLYGGGIVGKSFYEQNEMINWCQIVAIVDRDCTNKTGFPVPVISPEEAFRKRRFEFDSIIICIANLNERIKAKREILKYNIDPETLVDEIDFFVSRTEDNTIDYTMRDGTEKIKIGFFPGGVMGDKIISLRLYKELLKVHEDSEIWVFTGEQNYYDNALFSMQKGFKGFIFHYPNEADNEAFDLIIQSHFEPSILYCNMFRLKKFAPDLAERMMTLYQYQNKDLFFCKPYPYMNRIQIDRAKHMGLNCYSLLGCSGAFSIDDTVIDMPIDDSSTKVFNELELNMKYITYCYDNVRHKKWNRPQIKAWPYEHHLALNRLFKEKYPEIELVQLGANGNKKVDGADRYIFGQDIEVVKHILKNSLLHIDCEGGLVHLASQLGTKCVVMFGPTPVYFFGYENNENIIAGDCHNCCYLLEDWYFRCIKHNRPECMYSIKPEMVMDRVAKCIEENPF